MVLAALRGYTGCEVLAISNWLLRRDDQVGCVVFWPIDILEERWRESRPTLARGVETDDRRQRMDDMALDGVEMPVP